MKKNRIGIDFQSLLPQKTGYGAYVSCLWPEFQKYSDIEWRPIRSIQKELRTPQRMLWDQVGLPLRACMDRDRLLFVPAFSCPILYPGKIVFTLHDIVGKLFAEHFSFSAKWYWKHLLPRSAHRATHIITISQNTKRDIVRELGIPEKKITVIPLAPHPRYREVRDPHGASRALERLNIRWPFILSVGTLEPRKNTERLVQAFATMRRSEERLVIVGKKSWAFPEITKHVARYQLEDKVIFLDYVSDDDLVWLYNMCTFFVFPSLYEGFGMPPLEAMACGAPVIVSRTSSLPEVVGDAGWYIDPYDVIDIKDKMQALLEGEHFQRKLRVQSLVRAQEFSWERTAAETVRVLRNYL